MSLHFLTLYWLPIAICRKSNLLVRFTRTFMILISSLKHHLVSNSVFPSIRNTHSFRHFDLPLLLPVFYIGCSSLGKLLAAPISSLLTFSPKLSPFNWVHFEIVYFLNSLPCLREDMKEEALHQNKMITEIHDSLYIEANLQKIFIIY